MNRIKIILTFISLKLLEIGSILGLTFGMYYLGRLFNTIIKKESEGILSDWIGGFIFLFFILIAIGVVYLIIIFFKGVFELNWKWAVMLNETHEKRKIRERKNIKKKSKKNIKKLGYAVGDYVKENETGKSHLVEKIAWWGTHVKGYKDSDSVLKGDWILTKKGKIHKDIEGDLK